MESEEQRSQSVNEELVRLHAAVQPAADQHPVQGWELGELVALTYLSRADLAPEHQYYAGGRALSAAPRRVRDHLLQEGCSSCIEEIVLLMELFGDADAANLRQDKRCMHCGQSIPYNAVYCGYCGQKNHGVPLP
jgi:hypothetical protein